MFCLGLWFVVKVMVKVDTFTTLTTCRGFLAEIFGGKPPRLQFVCRSTHTATASWGQEGRSVRRVIDATSVKSTKQMARCCHSSLFIWMINLRQHSEVQQTVRLFSSTYGLLGAGACEVTHTDLRLTRAVGPHCLTHMKNAQRCKFVQTIYLNC